LEDDRIVRWDFAEEEAGDVEIRRAPEANALGSGAGNPASISIVGHQRQIEDFVGAVRDNRPPLIDGREGRKAVALVDAIYRSAREGRSARPT
jgi:predicted dehydrogenase